MVEIGAGGGSIAHVDTMARIEVGPESAGADPGPACYGRGGTKPTVTDANLLLGRYDPVRFAGGTMQLDTAAARDALLAEVGAPLGLAPEMAALGVIEIVDENMANAARVHAIESGKTYEGRTLIAFGGGGPVHACRLAEKVGIRRVLVPSGAGVGSAIGFLRAPVGYEVVRSLYQRLSTFDVERCQCVVDFDARRGARRGGPGAVGSANDRDADRLHAVCWSGTRNSGSAPDPNAVRRRCAGNSRGIRAGIREVLRSASARIGRGSDEFRGRPDNGDPGRRDRPAGHEFHRGAVNPIATRSRYLNRSSLTVGCP